MTVYRPHRFPPLDVVQCGTAPAAADTAAATQAFQAALQRGQSEGFVAGQKEGEQAGYEAGHAAGLRAGREEARLAAQAELERLTQPLNAMLQALQSLRSDWEASLRSDVIDLVERVSRQVVRCELTLRPAQMITLVEETLAAMPPNRSGPVEVFLNPGDLQRITELDAGRPARWALHADSALDAGECRVKVGDSELDAGCRQRLGACLEQLRAQLQPQEAA
jgi:flagellar assembly protein FliH